MSDFIGGVFAAALMIYLASCALVTPVFIVASYFEKRDCELITQVECRWQMLPAPPSQN